MSQSQRDSENQMIYTQVAESYNDAIRFEQKQAADLNMYVSNVTSAFSFAASLSHTQIAFSAQCS